MNKLIKDFEYLSNFIRAEYDISEITDINPNDIDILLSNINMNDRKLLMSIYEGNYNLNNEELLTLLNIFDYLKKLV